jgi:hypothetical protein
MLQTVDPTGLDSGEEVHHRLNSPLVRDLTISGRGARFARKSRRNVGVMNRARRVSREDVMATEREIVVITGSSGLIGSAVANRLHSQYHVIGFDRPGEPHPPAQIECIDFDVTSEESVREALQQVRKEHGERIASVIHLAAYYDFSGAPSDKYESITVRGTERLIPGRAVRLFQHDARPRAG